MVDDFGNLSGAAPTKLWSRYSLSLCANQKDGSKLPRKLVIEYVTDESAQFNGCLRECQRHKQFYLLDGLGKLPSLRQ